MYLYLFAYVSVKWDDIIQMIFEYTLIMIVIFFSHYHFDKVASFNDSHPGRQFYKIKNKSIGLFHYKDQKHQHPNFRRKVMFSPPMEI